MCPEPARDRFVISPTTVTSGKPRSSRARMFSVRALIVSGVGAGRMRGGAGGGGNRGEWERAARVLDDGKSPAPSPPAGDRSERTATLSGGGEGWGEGGMQSRGTASLSETQHGLRNSLCTNEYPP